MWSALLDVLFPAQCAGCNVLGSGLCAACAPACRHPIATRLADVPLLAYGRYEGVLRSAILALKDGRRDVAVALGARIAPLLERGAVLVPVPTPPGRRRARGIDGVACVATAAAHACGGSVCEALVHRARDAQRGRNRAARLAATSRFSCERPFDVAGRRIVLVDDVCTTGATLRDCSAALERAGAIVSTFVVIALTPLDDGGQRRAA